jgi:hypothetical protein
VSETTDPTASSGDTTGAQTGSSGDAAETRARVTAPSQQELDALPPDRRLELLELEHQRQTAERDRLAQVQDRRRQSRHQWFNSIGILLGAAFTAAGLIATAVTLQTGQQELRTAREGQITDRYTKAVEQLGSTKRDVRTAAIYALERISTDSPRDRTTIRDVMAAFVREHDPAVTTKDDKLPTEPDTDVHAALAVLGRRPTDPVQAPPLDLHNIRIRGTHLAGANLAGANLAGADLNGAHLTDTNLHKADLTGADLTGADLDSADLSGARLTLGPKDTTKLRRAHLFKANLTSAYLFLADLTDADLIGADLTGADLTDANLTHANLVSADLTNAVLLRAILSGAEWSSTDTHWPNSMGSVEEIRARSTRLIGVGGPSDIYVMKPGVRGNPDVPRAAN